MKRQDSGGYRLSLGTDENGKRIQAYFSSKRKQEVEFWIAEKMTARRDGGTIGKVIQVRTMAQLFEVWLEDHVRLSKAETTYPFVSIDHQTDSGMVHEVEGRSLEAIHAQRLLADWSRTSLKASTINSRRAILSSACSVGRSA